MPHVTLPYLLSVVLIVVSWFLLSAWMVVDRIVYDRRLQAVRQGRSGRLSWRVLARLAADSSSDPELADSLARLALERDEPGVLATAYGKGAAWGRVEALRVLARAGHSLSIAELQRMLAENEEEVVATAATILADIEGEEATAALIVGLGRGGSQTRWIAALLERRTVPARLVRPLVDDPEPAVREAGLRLLGSSTEPDRWIDQDLEDRCDDPLAEVRASAARALGRRARPGVENTLRRLLKDPVWFVQVQAARALGRLDRIASAREIASLLASTEWWVRQAAKDALVELGPRVSNDLVSLLDHPDPFARNSLAEVLQDIGVVDRLAADLQSRPSPHTRQSEQILRSILAAGGPQFAAAVLAQMPPAIRDGFSAFLSTSEQPIAQRVRAA
jgi:HEAT repeat protein